MKAYEYNVAEFKCTGCGELFTEHEVMEKARKDEACRNCGGTNFIKEKGK